MIMFRDQLQTMLKIFYFKNPTKAGQALQFVTIYTKTLKTKSRIK
jgi:hypothetical protein